MPPDLFNVETGETVSLDGKEAERAYKSGKFAFAKGARVPVINQAGQIGALDESQLGAAIQKGVRLALPDEVEAKEQADFRAEQREKYGLRGGVAGRAAEGLIAGGLGVVRGVGTRAVDAGLLKAAEAAGQDPAEARARLQYLEGEHPGATFAGEAAGMLGGAFLGNEAGAAAGAGTLGRSLGAVSRVGRAAEVGAEAIGGKAAASTLGRVAQGAIKGAAGAAAEGAIYGAGNAVSEAALGDHELNAEKVVAAAGHEALAWGGAGALLGGGGAFLGAARDSAGKFLSQLRPADVEAVAEKTFGFAPKGLGEKVADWYSKAASAATGEAPSTIRELIERRHEIGEAPIVRETAARDIRTHLDSLLSSTSDLVPEARGALKAEYVSKAVEKGNEDVTVPAVWETVKRLWEDLELMSAAPKEYGEKRLLSSALEYTRGLATQLRMIEEGGVRAAESPEIARVNRLGVDKADFLREGMRDMSQHAGAYTGVDAEQATRIATGVEPAVNSGKILPPIKIVVDGNDVVLQDGRHRLLAAKEAGAQKILADVITHNDAGEKIVRRAEVSIHGGPAPRSIIHGNVNAQMFTLIDNTKRAIGRWTKGLQAVERKADPLELLRGRATRDKFQEMYEGLRKGLEDTSLWGKAAEDQTQINQAWSRQIDAHRMFDQRLTTNVGRDPKNPWVDIRRVDPAKVDGYVAGLTNPKNDLVHGAIRSYVESTRDLADAIGRSYDLPPAKAAHVQTIKQSAEAFGKTVDKAGEVLSLANQFDALKKSESGGDLATAIGVAGALGHPILGLAGAAAGAIAKPATTLARLAAIERLVRKVDLRVASSVRSFVRAPAVESASTVREVAKVVQKAPRATSRVASLEEMRDRSKASPEEVFARKVAGIQSLATNPDRASAHLSESLSGLQDAAPQHALSVTSQTAKVTAYLASKVPQGMTDPYAISPRAKTHMVSDAERAQFARILAVANKPMTLLDSLERGTVTPEEVDTVRDCYPRLYDQVKTVMMQELAASRRELPYDRRIQLGTLFQVPTDATMSPEFLKSLHGAMAAAPITEGGNAMPAAPPTRPLNVAKDVATSFDAVGRR